MRIHALTLAALLLPAIAAAQTDPKLGQLPTVSGRVAQYSLTPNGDVDGLILEDGTEIHLPPHLGPSLVETVRPGDDIVARGLSARAIRMMDAVSITAVGSGRTITDAGPPAPGSQPKPPHEEPTERVSIVGTIRMWLHGPKGDVNGVLLEDGTIVRLPPGFVPQGADQLRPGGPIKVSGRAIAGPTGRVVVVDRPAAEAPRAPVPRREPASLNGAPHP